MGKNWREQKEEGLKELIRAKSASGGIQNSLSRFKSFDLNLAQALENKKNVG